MSTRGAFGFRYKGRDLTTYNHFDSYPSGLGTDIVDALKDRDLEQLAGTAERIEFYDQTATPPPEAVERYKQFHAYVSSGNDWYALLSGAQGRIDLLIDGTVSHMSDASSFLLDSLLCEWAYIIDLDDRTFEVYQGFVKSPGTGRYDSQSVDDGYWGVQRVSVTPLPLRFDDEWVETMHELMSELQSAEELATV